MSDGDDSSKRGKPNSKSEKKRNQGRASSCPSGHDEPQKAMFDFLNVTIHASVKGKPSATARGLIPGSWKAGGGGTGLDRRKSSLDDGGRDLSLKGNADLKKTASGSSAAPSVMGGNGAVPQKASGKRAADMSRSELRSHLVGAREAEAALVGKAARLQQTVERNAERDPKTAAQARQKLEEVNAQARDVQASRVGVERILGHKGKGKGGGSGGGKGGMFSF